MTIRRPGLILGGELTTILQEILLCAHHDLSLVSIYSDSLKTIQVVTVSMDFLGPGGVLVHQIKTLLHDSMIEGLFLMRCQANLVSHKLAKNGF